MERNTERGVEGQGGWMESNECMGLVSQDEMTLDY